MAEKEPKFPLKAVTCGLIALVALTSLFLYVNSTASGNYEATYHNLYGVTPVAGGNYSFSPPISKYHAIDIALASDGWNQSSLQNMTIHASLNKIIFYTNTSAILQYEKTENITLNFQPGPVTNSMSGSGSGIITVGEVTEPVSDYKPIFFDGLTVRYIWSITVTQNEGITIPPPGLYYIDASSGDLVPTGHLF